MIGSGRDRTIHRWCPRRTRRSWCGSRSRLRGGGMCQQRVSKAASVCGNAEKKGGERRSRASIARRSRTRSHARKPPVSGRTLHGDERGAERRERQQRLAARHTRGRHRARAREKSSSRVSRLRAPSGCSFSRDPRRAIDRRVSFPSKRSSRSGFAPDGAGDQLVRVKLCGGRTLADPMLARSKSENRNCQFFSTARRSRRT